MFFRHPFNVWSSPRKGFKVRFLKPLRPIHCTLSQNIDSVLLASRTLVILSLIGNCHLRCSNSFFFITCRINTEHFLLFPKFSILILLCFRKPTFHNMLPSFPSETHHIYVASWNSMKTKKQKRLWYSSCHPVTSIWDLRFSLCFRLICIYFTDIL